MENGLGLADVVLTLVARLQDGNVDTPVVKKWASPRAPGSSPPLLRVEPAALQCTGHAHRRHPVVVLVPAVVPGPRQALRVLVAHLGRQGLVDRRRRDVFRRNKRDVGALPPLLLLDQVRELWVRVFQGLDKERTEAPPPSVNKSCGEACAEMICFLLFVLV